MGKIKQEIEKYLKKHKYCVLCTCSNDDPRATSVRYEVGEDLTVIIYSENYTKKFNHLKKNKKVAIALHNQRMPYKGLQLWGTAEVVTPDDPRHFEYLPKMAKKSEKMREACKVLNLILVKPERIVMLGQLKMGGSYVLWEKGKKGKETERAVKTAIEMSKL
jgi:uncharacterized pyridoxamine 5'-phosphate oxidase family protein